MTFYTIKVSLDNTLKQFTRFMRYRIISLLISAFIPWYLSVNIGNYIHKYKYITIPTSDGIYIYVIRSLDL